MPAALLNAMVLATPFFGFSLDCPLDSLAPPSAVTRSLQEIPDAADPDAPADEAEVDVTVERQVTPPESPPLTEGAILDVEDDHGLEAAASERRGALALYGAFHLATLISMAGTAVLGAIQLYDDYGFTDSENETPCARNEAVFGFCDDEAPIPHMIGAGLTTLLYGTTFALSFTIPDPLGVEESNTREGSRWRAHEVLRWLHLTSLGLQAVFGVITANADMDFETRQSFAWVHMGLGVTTFSLFAADGALVFF